MNIQFHVLAPRLLAIASLALLSACAATANRPAAVASTPEIERLYADIDLLSQRVEAADEQILHGDVALGETERSAALQAMREAGGRCTALPGCDMTRFLNAYDALLAPRPQLAAEAGLGEGAALADTADTSPVADTLPEVQRSVDLLRGRDVREFIQLNPPIQAALNEWLTWMRPLLLDSFENYQYMRHRMWPEYEKAGLPEALLFGILAKESGGRVHAVSRAGASGPLQFMPATGQRFGLGRRADGFDTRFDPALATRANVQYLNERFAEFNTDLALSLAAYNGGEGRMARLHRSSGGKSFWSNSVQSQLPAETRDYVPMVLAAAWLFLHPDEYGIEFPVVDGAAAELRLGRASSLNGLAICLGDAGTRSGWFRTLRNLNPKLDPSTVLPAGSVLDVPAALIAAYQASCVDGPRIAFAEQIGAARATTASAGPRVVASSSKYTVRRGDTLASIARKRGCSSPQALARANRIAAPKYLIHPGQTLSLQGCRG